MKFKIKIHHNPDGYGGFLVRKFAKRHCFKAILPYLVVANAIRSFFSYLQKYQYVV